MLKFVRNVFSQCVVHNHWSGANDANGYIEQIECSLQFSDFTNWLVFHCFGIFHRCQYIMFRTFSEAVRKVEEATGLSRLQSTAGVQQMKEFLRAHITPTIYQFKSRPLAGWVRQVAKSVFDDYNSRANAWLYGENQLSFHS